MGPDRYAELEKGGLDIRDVLGVAEGYTALGAAVLQAAVGQDPTWPEREPIAARFWCDVACLDPGAFKNALERWQAQGQQT